MSFHISLIAHELVSRKTDGDVDLLKDLWPDTDGHYICIIAAFILGIWHAYFNKFGKGMKMFALLIFGSYDKWYEKLVEGMIFAFICYVALAIFYILGHDVFYH